MTITNRISPPEIISRPSLDAFQQAAKEGDWVHVSRDGSNWKVLATGVTPSQRSVAWIEPEADSTSAFVGALGASFSSGIQSAVVRELGLAAAPGKPLSSRTVNTAIEMAQTSQKTMLGVDFMTRITLSAVNDGAGFRDACARLGIAADSFEAKQRDQVDSAMQRRFEDAAATGRSPVALDTAKVWLEQELVSIQR